MAEYLVRDVLVPIAPFTDRKVAAPALFTFAADDREGNNDPITDLQRAVALPTSTTRP
jgi:hypothetical protein